MSPVPPPLRFLAAVVGGWAAVRAAMLAPWWPAEAGSAASPLARVQARARAVAPPVVEAASIRRTASPSLRPPGQPARAAHRPAFLSPEREDPGPPLFAAASVPTGSEGTRHDPPRTPLPLPAPEPSRAAGRWSGSAWALVRGGDPGAALAAGGTLSGSQVGMRLTYRLGSGASPPLALSARLSAPAGRPAGAEAALGLEWRPARALPLRLLAERRQAVGREGRSAFALIAFGGVDDRPVGAGLRLDAYAQAGMVGVRSRDLFADGSARLSLPLDRAKRIRLGAGAWAAAQPGVARLDAGPQAALRLPGITLALEWRFRLAGDVAPGSGPAATLAADF